MKSQEWEALMRMNYKEDGDGMKSQEWKSLTIKIENPWAFPRWMWKGFASPLPFRKALARLFWL